MYVCGKSSSERIEPQDLEIEVDVSPGFFDVSLVVKNVLDSLQLAYPFRFLPVASVCVCVHNLSDK